MSKPLLTSRISKAEYSYACSVYTMQELCRIFCISSTGARKLTNEYGCRPLQICRKCKHKFTPDGPNTYNVCPSCSAGKTPEIQPKKFNPDHSVRYGQKITREIENEASRRGISYADVQKQRTLDMVGRINVGDFENGCKSEKEEKECKS